MSQEKKSNKSYILKINHKNNFTMIDNAILYDKNLSAKATCYLSIILSFPKDWKISTAHLGTLKKDGIDTVRTSLTELRALGYLYLHQIRNAKGQIIKHIHLASETPMTEEEFKKCLPQVDFPDVAEPDVAKAYTTNTHKKLRTHINKKHKEAGGQETVSKDTLTSNDAHLCGKYLFEKLKGLRQDRKEPNWKEWTKDLELMIRVDGISKEKIIATIDWLFDTDNKFVVASAGSLRSKYEKIADHRIQRNSSLINKNMSKTNSPSVHVGDWSKEEEEYQKQMKAFKEKNKGVQR